MVRGKRSLLFVGLLILTSSALPAMVSASEGTEGALAELMERNRQHFRQLVEPAYFESVEKHLSAVDFQRIRQQAEAITNIARQARQEHSRGESFDELASELEKHAEKAAVAASKEHLPEVNLQIGEMAEYCAECHKTFRWKDSGR